MKWCVCLVLVCVVLVVAAPKSSAQWFGPKKPKTSPQQRVPELIIALKAEKDAHKRADAAEELRQFDLKEFPEIIPVLIDALQSDPATSVRIEAATGLGRLRPISTQAGQALEKAVSGDPNLRVRLQAKASLVYYQLSGYHAPKKNEPAGPILPGRTDEPPLAVPGTAAGEAWWQNGSAAFKTPSSGSSNVSRPMPAGPSLNPQVPVVTVPSTQPQQGPQQGPTIPTAAPALQPPPQPQWAPVQREGPKLSPAQ